MCHFSVIKSHFPTTKEALCDILNGVTQKGQAVKANTTHATDTRHCPFFCKASSDRGKRKHAIFLCGHRYYCVWTTRV